jgi:hypothetical protein
LIGFVGWFFGATIGFQLNEMTERIPDGLLWRTNQIESRPYARDVLAKLEIADFSGTTGLIAKSRSLGVVVQFRSLSELYSIRSHAQGTYIS